MKKIVLAFFIFVFSFIFNPFLYAQSAKQTILQVVEKKLMVNGKSTLVYDVVQPDGTFGYVGKKGELFDVVVENKTRVPLVLHWHGLIDPNSQDGVPFVTQLPIPVGGKYHYKFKLNQAGTFWLHSHYQLQEQKLMAAPLIIHDGDEKKEKEALMFIQDFTFTDPNVIYKRLRNADMGDMKSKMNMDDMKGKMNMDHAGMSHSMQDVSDVKFDAYLTNKRTLQNPSVVRVTANESVRLRIINASASSNYYIDLGKLKGTLFAVDATPIKPIQGSRFQIAIGNRLDIRVNIPKGEGVYPILALPEGTKQQTGLILATSKATLPKFSEKTASSNALLDNSQEFKLQAANPLPTRPIAQSLVYNLEGNMQSYRWTINGQEWPNVTPFEVKYGQRVELVFNNKTGMSHPMHLHGHVFQITEINGKKIEGRQGDTINILPGNSMKVILDMDNPGIWMMHCHILYHQMGGMMTTINYANYPNRFTKEQREQGESIYGMTLKSE